jgi:hypothetical protein
MTPAWFSQPVPPLGAIKAEGIKNQLGRPDLDPLTILVREAAQNSWDARDPDTAGPVRFSLALDTMRGARADAWRDLLRAHIPPRSSLDLAEYLDESDIDILFVGDRGTGGLGGPTRADATVEGLRHDYVSFVLNVGDPRDVEHGGGTYGFGKAVFFLGSRASSVLIHTRCLDENERPESRLVGCALGRAFTTGGRSYTGRHWFGRHLDEDIFEPIVGAEADAAAQRLGFPPFSGDDLGTTIAVIAPRLYERAPEDVCRHLADAILWHLWPKMIADDGPGPAMTFLVTRDAQPFPVPEPESHPVVREFARALRALDEDGDVITYGSGTQPIGGLNLVTPFRPLPELDNVADEAGLGDSVHHCCMLRTPELVVEYRPGPLPTDPLAWYAGVFKVLPDMDDVFAQSEPPTHDAWTPTNLERRQRSVVQTTLRKVDEALKRHAAPIVVPATDDDAHVGGLAAASRMLGALLAPTTGEGAGPRKSGQTGAKRTSRLKMVGDPYWIRHDGRDLLAQDFDVDGSRTLTAEALLKVRLWGGGAASDWDVNPSLLGWRSPSGDFKPSSRVAIERIDAGRWTALVNAPADTVVSIRVREAKGDGDA